MVFFHKSAAAFFLSLILSLSFSGCAETQSKEAEIQNSSQVEQVLNDMQKRTVPETFLENYSEDDMEDLCMTINAEALPNMADTREPYYAVKNEDAKSNMSADFCNLNVLLQHPDNDGHILLDDAIEVNMDKWETLAVAYKQIMLHNFSVTRSNLVLQTKIIQDAIYIQYSDEASVYEKCYIGKWNLKTGQLIKRIQTDSKTAFQFDQKNLVVLGSNQINYYNLDLNMEQSVVIDPHIMKVSRIQPQLSLDAQKILFIKGDCPAIYTPKSNQIKVLDDLKPANNFSYSAFSATHLKDSYFLITSKNDAYYYFTYHLNDQKVKNIYFQNLNDNNKNMIYCNLYNGNIYIEKNRSTNFSCDTENGIIMNGVDPITDHYLRIMDLNKQKIYITNVPLKQIKEIEVIAVNSNGSTLAGIIADQDSKNYIIIFCPQKSTSED
ncbi:MAG: hypothetical protein PHV07_08880 [Oscillospiraceae bacterium]|nr:hypothetical protein [Oscillospiraceae bacterium]